MPLPLKNYLAAVVCASTRRFSETCADLLRPGQHGWQRGCNALAGTKLDGSLT